MAKFTTATDGCYSICIKYTFHTTDNNVFIGTLEICKELKLIHGDHQSIVGRFLLADWMHQQHIKHV